MISKRYLYINFLTLGQFWHLGIFMAPVYMCMCVCLCFSHGLVHMIWYDVQARTTKFKQKMQNASVKTPVVWGLIDFDLHTHNEVESKFHHVWFVHQSKYTPEYIPRPSPTHSRPFTGKLFSNLITHFNRWEHSLPFVGGGGAFFHIQFYLLFGAVYWSRQPRIFQHLTLFVFLTLREMYSISKFTEIKMSKTTEKYG